jgi:S-(hydroxymethyl)glutathione dehydrogenase/alcohol dehydrogenase
VFFAANEPHRLVEIDVDDPAPGEVRVRMAATGVCHSCLYAMNGQHAGIPKPILLGDEGAGIVEKVGAGVHSVTPGDHVIVSWAPGCPTCRTCRQGLPALCQNQPAFGRMADGRTRYHLEGQDVFHYGPATNAPLAVLPERAVVRIPDSIPLDIAAMMGCAVATGVGAVRTSARVRLGDRIAVVGCGGVGSTVLMAAAAAGAYPRIAIDVATDRFETLRQLGATHCVDPRDPKATNDVREISDGGVDYSFITTSATSAFTLALDVLAPRGTGVLIAGYPDDTQLALNPVTILNGERRVIGAKYGSSNPPVDFPELCRLYEAGVLPLDQLVSGRWPMEQIDEAYDALARGKATRGIVVLNPDLV